MSPPSLTPELLLASSTPGLFARQVSRGRWKMARHLGLVDEAITTAIARTGTPRTVIIEAPPRHGKSELISRYLPGWFLGTFPEKRVILASYEANFARSWGRKARELLAEHGETLFGVGVSAVQHAAVDWETTAGGGMVTAGIGGPLTGRGADLLIVDDPIKNAEEATSETIREKHWDWWQSTASTRLEPGGCCVVIATRWHEDDLTGRLLRQSRDDGTPITRVCMPAIAEAGDLLGRPIGAALWPERWSLDALERIRGSRSPRWWQTLYQQRPSRHEAAEWPEEYFGPHIWGDRWPDSFELSAMGVDPSKGRDRGDFSGIVWGGLSGGCCWIDASIARRPPEAIVRDAIAMACQYRPGGVMLEANQFQSLLAPEFDRQCRERSVPPLPMHLVDNRENKELRIRRLGPFLLRRKLRFRDTPGCRLLVQQLREFPLSEHDDGPDALEMCIRMLWQLTGAGPIGDRIPDPDVAHV